MTKRLDPDAPVAPRIVHVDGEEQHDPVALGQELAEEVNHRFLEHIRGRGKPTSWPTIRASSLGDPCLRRMVYRRTQGELAADVDDVGLAIFNTGNLLEGPIRRMVEEMGFDIERSQMSFPRNDFNISGHIDGFIRHRKMPVLYVLEIKTLNGTTWKQLNTFQDIAEHSRSWVSKYAAQGQIYAALSEICRWGEELPVLGVLYVLFNKWTGQLKAIPAPLDYHMAEGLLDKAVEIEAHVKAGSLPDFIDDPEECRTCPFVGRACHPPINFSGGPTMQVIDDLDVVADLETVTKKEGDWKEYEEAWERLFGGKAGRLRGIELAVVPCPGEEGGHWEVRGKWSSNTTYPVPKEVKERFKRVDPEGKWLPRVARVEGVAQ